MSTATFDAIDLALLILIGVATPLICFGGIGLAYLAQERGSAKRAPAGRRATEPGAEQREMVSTPARSSDDSISAASDAHQAYDRVGH
ncbi:hypothetical protein ACWCOV_25365 [Kribbella sp. NPDC002412]